MSSLPLGWKLIFLNAYSKLGFGVGLERRSPLIWLNRTRRGFSSQNNLVWFACWDNLGILHLAHPCGVLDLPSVLLWGTQSSLVLWKHKCSNTTKVIRLVREGFWQKLNHCDKQKMRENDLIVPAGLTLDDNHEIRTLVTCLAPVQQF